MANKPGRVGRDGEHKVVEYLQRAGFEDAEREGKRAASLDIVAPGLSLPVEAKRRATISLPQWTRQLEERHGDRWALFIIQRDARKNIHPDLMVVPAELGARLLKLAEEMAEVRKALESDAFIEDQIEWIDRVVTR